jgi:hypothetical protein
MSSERPPIRGKVARIVNSRELAINVGARHGVQVGMHFDVLDAQASDIKDPDTGESLGSIHKPKIRVKVTRVEDRVSLAATYRVTQTNLGGSGLGSNLTSGSSWSKLFEAPHWVVKRESLRAKDHGVDTLDEADSLVKIGEVVVEVTEPDGDK